MSVIGEFVPAGMTEHVWMKSEFKLCSLARTHHQLAKPFRRQRCPPLTHEHIPIFDFFPVQSS